MKRFSLYLTLMIAVVLTACNTTVITDEDRQLPEAPPPAAMEEEKDEENMEEKMDDEEDDEDEKMMEKDDEDDDEDEDEEEEEEEEKEEEKMMEKAAPKSYEANTSESFIAFTGAKGTMVSHEGKFNSYDFSFEHPGNIADGTIKLSIEIGSMQTDSDGLTKHLLNEDFFEADTYPSATFMSNGIVAKGGDAYTVTGDLTMKGKTNSVSFDAQITDLYLTMKHPIDRLAFGVGDGSKGIDQMIPIEAKIVFQ